MKAGTTIKVVTRSKRGSETWLWRVSWVEQRHSAALYIGYVPVKADGSWDSRGGFWGCASLPLAEGPHRFGVVHWRAQGGAQ